jgi:hypothetical protein
VLAPTSCIELPPHRCQSAGPRPRTVGSPGDPDCSSGTSPENASAYDASARHADSTLRPAARLPGHRRHEDAHGPSQPGLRPEPRFWLAKACPERSRTERQERQETRANNPVSLGDLCVFARGINPPFTSPYRRSLKLSGKNFQLLRVSSTDHCRAASVPSPKNAWAHSPTCSQTCQKSTILIAR